MREIVGLLHRQRIHVRAQPDRHLPVALTQHTHDAGAAKAAMHLDPPFRQFCGDDVRRALLLEANLGMRMQIAPDRREFVVEDADIVDRGHCSWVPLVLRGLFSPMSGSSRMHGPF